MCRPLASGQLLLHGDGFGQVARLVDVAAAADGDVVGQQLQRHNLNQRRQQLRRRQEWRSRAPTRPPMVVSPSVATAITRPERAVTS